MILRCDDRDFELICAIINDGTQAYRGIIPADRWTEPYMSREELRRQIDEGVVFWGDEEAGTLVAVMGIQPVQDVTLIRHAYVRTTSQQRGIGARLQSHLRGLASGPVLIGTWADAVWAIHFYERHGFQLVSAQEKDRLLRKYWTIPDARLKPRWFWRIRSGGKLSDKAQGSWGTASCCFRRERLLKLARSDHCRQAWKVLVNQALVELRVEIGAAVFDDDEAIVAVQGSQKSRQHHAAGRHAEQDQRLDISGAQEQIEIGPGKCADPALRDHQIARGRCQRGMYRTALPLEKLLVPG